MDISRDVVDLLKLKAQEAADAGEVPVSAVVVDGMGNVVSCCRNERYGSNCLLDHAEVLAILEAERVVGDWRLNGYKMVVSLEPCLMCSAIIKESRLDCVYFFVHKCNYEEVVGISSVYVDGYEEDKVFFEELLSSFFGNLR